MRRLLFSSLFLILFVAGSAPARADSSWSFNLGLSLGDFAYPVREYRYYEVYEPVAYCYDPYYDPAAFYPDYVYYCPPPRYRYYYVPEPVYRHRAVIYDYYPVYACRPYRSVYWSAPAYQAVNFNFYYSDGDRDYWNHYRGYDNDRWHDRDWDDDRHDNHGRRGGDRGYRSYDRDWDRDWDNNRRSYANNYRGNSSSYDRDWNDRNDRDRNDRDGYNGDRNDRDSNRGDGDRRQMGTIGGSARDRDGFGGRDGSRDGNRPGNRDGSRTDNRDFSPRSSSDPMRIVDSRPDSGRGSIDSREIDRDSRGGDNDRRAGSDSRAGADNRTDGSSRRARLDGSSSRDDRNASSVDARESRQRSLERSGIDGRRNAASDQLQRQQRAEPLGDSARGADSRSIDRRDGGSSSRVSASERARRTDLVRQEVERQRGEISRSDAARDRGVVGSRKPTSFNSRGDIDSRLRGSSGSDDRSQRSGSPERRELNIPDGRTSERRPMGTLGSSRSIDSRSDSGRREMQRVERGTNDRGGNDSRRIERSQSSGGDRKPANIDRGSQRMSMGSMDRRDSGGDDSRRSGGSDRGSSRSERSGGERSGGGRSGGGADRRF